MRLFRAVLAVGLLAAGAALPPSEAEAPRLAAAEPHHATLAELKARLDASDRRAALEALHVALTTKGDGDLYVWRRESRQLAGAIRPTRAFQDTDGRICRHIIYVLMLGRYSRQIEGIACRQAGGGWSVSG